MNFDEYFTFIITLYTVYLTLFWWATNCQKIAIFCIPPVYNASEFR